MHDIEHEEWCAAVAAGDVASLSAELVKAIETCPECSRRLAGMRDLQSTLARIGADEREIVAAAKSMKPLASERAISERLHELGGVRNSKSDRASSVQPWRRRLLALAAAVLIGCIGFLAWRAGRSNTPRNDDVLGEGVIEYVSPVGPQTVEVPFVWRYELRADSYFQVTVRATDDAATVLVESPKLHTNIWTPSAEDRAKITGNFKWSVQVFDSSNAPPRAGRWVPASLPP